MPDFFSKINTWLQNDRTQEEKLCAWEQITKELPQGCKNVLDDHRGLKSIEGCIELLIDRIKKVDLPAREKYCLHMALAYMYCTETAFHYKQVTAGKDQWTSLRAPACHAIENIVGAWPELYGKCQVSQSQLATMSNGEWSEGHDAIFKKMPKEWPIGFCRDFTFWLLGEKLGDPLNAPTTSGSVLLVDMDRAPGERGIVAFLQLEKLPVGSGDIYPSPCVNMTSSRGKVSAFALIYCDEVFRQSLATAVKYLKTQKLWPQKVDIRWSVIPSPKTPVVLHGLSDVSMGAALAAGMEALLKDNRSLPKEVAISAKVDEDGRFYPVEGITEKLIAANKAEIDLVILAQNQELEKSILTNEWTKERYESRLLVLHRGRM